MKKNIIKLIQLILLSSLTAILISIPLIDFAAQYTKVKTVLYEPSSQDFPNPERGLFIQYSPGNNPFPPLNVSELKELRKQNITLIRAIYLISEFRNVPLSSAFLNRLNTDFAIARQAGIKVIPRFSYNWLGGGSDATQERILSHQEQLKPVLEANYDVISFVEAGFIGHWGEWNRSTHGLQENPEARKSILLNLLSVLPSKRMVAIRYSHHKEADFKNPFLVQGSAAFNRQQKARIGAHNDCFLAGIDDWGTYHSSDPQKIAQQKAFLQQDNLFVVQGGELCNYNPPRTDCPTALAELAQMRWSALNYYPPKEELNIIFRDWQQQGCLSEVRRRLGYRFRLIESKLNQGEILRGMFELEFIVVNDGWASPYNPRKLEIILRHNETHKEYYFTNKENPRLWQPGTKNTIKVLAKLPPNISPGDYQILLNLPDPHPHLYDRPEYSIRFANQDIWESNTGYNCLKLSALIPKKYRDNKPQTHSLPSFRLRQTGESV
jgi:hypothetical protein